MGKSVAQDMTQYARATERALKLETKRVIHPEYVLVEPIQNVDEFPDENFFIVKFINCPSRIRSTFKSFIKRFTAIPIRNLFTFGSTIKDKGSYTRICTIRKDVLEYIRINY